MIENGTEINGHTITGELGRGGMGVVYKAYDKTLERASAIKMMLPEQATETNKKRFIREAASIAKCDHPGIINVYSYGEHGGLPYFIMEFVDGKTLFSFLELARTLKKAGDLEELKKYGYIRQPSPEDEDLPYFLRPLAAPPLTDGDYEGHAAALVAGIADALYEAHSLGILHRDIKPSNILLAKRGLPKLADFGLAKMKDSGDITTGLSMLGTLKYMAPEIFANAEATPASDIYSLGTVFYELLTLEHPFETENTAAFIKAVTQDPCREPAKLNPEVSPALNLVIMKCLAKDPAARFLNARDLADAIRLGVRPRGLKTQLFEGIKTMLRPSERTPAPVAPEEAPLPQVEEDDRQEAARLMEEAKKAYFLSLAFTKTLNLTTEALKLDPGSLDVNFMLIVISNHMGMHSALRKALPRLKRLGTTAPDGNTRARAALMASYLERDKDWRKKADKYLRGAPDDIYALAVAARTQVLTDYKKTGEYLEKLIKLIPGSEIYAWLMEQYRTEWLGRTGKYIESNREFIKKFPGNITLRLFLIEMLIDSGRLKEAGEAMDEALKLAPAEDALIYLHGELLLYQKDYQAACAEFRKFIGIGPDEMKPYAYHTLAKIYTLRGDPEEARRHLDIARNLAPDRNLKSNDELAELVSRLKKFQSGLEGLPPEALRFNLEKCKEALSRNLLSAHNVNNTTSSEIYCFEKDGRPRAACLWLLFSEHDPGDRPRIILPLPSLPLSSFTDWNGNILKTDYRRVDSAYGKYLGTVEFTEPLKNLTAGPIETELDLDGLWEEKAGGETELRLDEVMPQPSYKCRILALPEDSEIISLSEQPDETVTEAGTRYLVYSRFFFDTEHFRLTAKFRHKQA